MNEFAERVLRWYELHGRKDLPWQVSPTPYRVWVSEIMLQQTQVITVIPYYERFMTSFPDVITLAGADTDDVLHHWSGLGYYARARNLHKTAQIIRDDLGGAFPASVDEVVALPGIGRSTAGAILALSRNERHPILDGNVKRVLARHYAVDGWPGRTAVSRELWRLADLNTPANQVADYTQAMMDLGATVCVRTSPNCNACPLSSDCVAHGDGREKEFPGRKPKQAKPRRQTHMVLVQSDDAIYLERRPPTGIWGGLYSFPELESAEDVADWCRSKLNATLSGIEARDMLSHSFTHFDLDIHPLVVQLGDVPAAVADNDRAVWYKPQQPSKIGIAAPVMELIRSLG